MASREYLLLCACIGRPSEWIAAEISYSGRWEVEMRRHILNHKVNNFIPLVFVCE